MAPHARPVGGVALIYPVLKGLFDRPRPQLFEWRVFVPLRASNISMVLLVVLAYIVQHLSGSPGPCFAHFRRRPIREAEQRRQPSPDAAADRSMRRSAAGR